MTMLTYPILILVLFVRILSVGADGKLTKAWSFAAFLAFLMGVFFPASMWFIVGVGAGLTGLVVGLLPCLIVSVILIWLLYLESPIKLTGNE